MKPQLLQENLEKLKIVDGEEVVKVSGTLLRFIHQCQSCEGQNKMLKEWNDLTSDHNILAQSTLRKLCWEIQAGAEH